VEASAQVHRALDEITRNGNSWATPAQIAKRVHLDEVVLVLSDVVEASHSRAERFVELPTELAGAGHLVAPARLLATAERLRGGREPEFESAVRTTDVANKRIVVVRPEQTTAATETASALARQLTSLTAALGTIPLGRQSRFVVDSASSVAAVAPGARPLAVPLANVQRANHATVFR